MPRVLAEPGSPDDWLRHARSDLALARTPPRGPILLETLCYHLQQAAEKSIKAVLVLLKIPWPRTHNLGALLELLPEDCAVPDMVAEATILTDYAVLARYPGRYEPVSRSEYEHAADLAQAVMAWAEELVTAS